MTNDAASPWLTIAELADRLGVAETTVRNWSRAYREQIAVAVGNDGYRRYSLARFEAIAVLRNRKLPPGEIRAALARQAEAPPPAPLESFESAVLARLDRLVAAVERLAAQLAPPGGD